MHAAQRAMRPALRKRFYRDVAIEETAEGFGVLLDGKPVRTPARNPLAMSTQPLAQALADEWSRQSDSIDPDLMPLTRLANSIIDGVTTQSAAVREEIEKYLGSDLLFYRAEGPASLVELQTRHWDPVMAWARDTLGARFVLAEGVVFTSQPSQSLEAARHAIPADAWRLGAMHSVTTLTGSALLALALLHDAITADQVWTAAHVDEDWNMERWGQDETVLTRRALRRTELDAAATVMALLR
jgi:chaperone required for assembly of F1-ATPase